IVAPYATAWIGNAMAAADAPGFTVVNGALSVTTAAGTTTGVGALALNDVRLDTVHAKLKELGAWRVADLGCGEAKLLQRLAQDRKFTRLIGLDASARELEKAARRLKLERAGALVERITLLHGALTYRDARWSEIDAACLVEVIEHLDAERLPALEA